MTSFIIDASKDKIFLKIILDDKSYTNEYSNSSENFDKLGLIIFEFFKKNNVKLTDLKDIFVNQGPGNYSGIRSSIVICKAFKIVKNINLYGFTNEQIQGKNYNKVLDLLKKEVLIKDLIKPLYKDI